MRFSTTILGQKLFGGLPLRPGRLLSLLLLCVLIGCGGNAASVSGKVSFNGKPVEKGGIRLDILQGTSSVAAAAPITNGQYTIPASAGLVAGEYRVMLSASQDTGKKRLDRETGQQVPIINQLIPEKYNTASELKMKLEPGANTKDFDLKP
jgi:hypothetical protein